MKNFKSILFILFIGLFAWSCDQDLIEVKPDPDPDPTPPPTVPDPGSLDFSKFVSIGNSLTAGVQAQTLFSEGQANSMPLILHTQFSEAADAGDFNQPDINSEFGYTGGGPGAAFGRLLLQGDPPAPTPQPTDDASIPGPPGTPFDFDGDRTALNNFGVGGILLASALFPETGDWGNPAHPLFNPYYARFASDPGTSTILGDALAAQPTFFMFWLGNNDVLGYATTGGSGAIPLTDVPTFTFLFEQAMGALTLSPGFTELEGVVGNIPSVTSIPFFTSVPWNAIPLDQATADLVNGSYADYNNGLDGAVLLGIITADEAAARKIVFEERADNPFVIDDESLTQDVDISAAFGAPPGTVVLPNIRQTTSDDIPTLTSGSVLGTLADPGNPLSIFGVAVPMPDQYVLIPAEVTEINAAIDGYNAAIPAVLAGLGVDSRVAVADVNAGLTEFVNSGGVFQDGVLLVPTLAPPYAAWSEDGVHPNSRGYAFTANIFIDAINAKFGANIPHANIADYAPTALPIP